MQSTRTRLTIAICRDRRYHGLGFGGDLLVDALGRIALAADSLGIAGALLPQCQELQLNQPEPCFSSPARLALALPVRWLCRRGIADGGGWVRRGKELLLEALDSGVALLQQLQALLAFEQLLLAFERFDPQPLCFLLDVVNGSPVAQLLRRRLRLRQQAPPRRQGGDPS